MQPPGTSGTARAWIGLLAIGLCVLAPAMDTSVNIAMPSITAAFALGQRDIQWVVTCYMLAYASLMLTCGKLGDLFGHRRILRAGLVLCAVAFSICALATVYPILLAGRALQGVGIALAVSCAPALATSLYPESGRTWVLGIYGAIFALGTALGPFIGSLLVGQWGWSAVFAFRAPLVVVALMLTALLPPGLPTRAGESTSHPFDWTGAVLLVLWNSALMLAAAGPHNLDGFWPARPEWVPSGPALSWTLAAVGGLGLLLFLRHEAGFAEPIIRPGLFRSARFAVLNAANLLINLTNFSIMLIVPYFLINAAHLRIDRAGIILAMSGVGMMLGSWATGRLGGRIPAPRLAFAGTVVTGLGLLTVGQWTADMPEWRLASTLLAQGFGVGLFQVAYNDSVIATLPTQDRGVAGSLTMMVRTLGILGGATGLSALLKAGVDSGLAAGLAPEPAFLAAFQQTLTIAGSALIAGLALTLVRPRVWR